MEGKVFIMALQMPVYKELNSVEPKVMAGMTWRQWAAVIGMGALGGGSWAVCSLLLHQDDLGQIIVLLVCIPFAAYGWWRPLGLKPEKYLPYLWRWYMGGGHRIYHDGPAGRVRTGVRPSIKEH